jgi:hypothetical protein
MRYGPDGTLKSKMVGEVLGKDTKIRPYRGPYPLVSSYYRLRMDTVVSFSYPYRICIYSGKQRGADL